MTTLKEQLTIDKATMAKAKVKFRGEKNRAAISEQLRNEINIENLKSDLNDEDALIDEF